MTHQAGDRQKEESKEAIPPPSGSRPLQPEEPPQCSVFFEPKQWSRRYADTFFTASIVSHSLHADHTVLYHIRVMCRDAQWTVEHRYSDFEQLIAAVQSQYTPQTPSASSSSSSSAPLPALPPKTWLPSREERFVKERQDGLQTFLVDLLQRKDMCRLRAVRDFLLLDTPVPAAPDEQSTDEDGDSREPQPDQAAASNTGMTD